MQNWRLKKYMDNAKATKSKFYLHQIINATILAGIIILFTGIYYCVVKAGIPYQDPPLELQIQYAITMGISAILVKNGFLIFVCGILAHFLFNLVLKKRKRE